MVVTSSLILIDTGTLSGVSKCNQCKPSSHLLLVEISQSLRCNRLSRITKRNGRSCSKSWDSSISTSTLLKSMSYHRMLPSTINGSKMSRLSCKSLLIRSTSSLVTTFKKCGCCRDLSQGKRLKTPARIHSHTARAILSVWNSIGTRWASLTYERKFTRSACSWISIGLTNRITTLGLSIGVAISYHLPSCTCEINEYQGFLH